MEALYPNPGDCHTCGWWLQRPLLSLLFRMGDPRGGRGTQRQPFYVSVSHLPWKGCTETRISLVFRLSDGKTHSSSFLSKPELSPVLTGLLFPQTGQTCGCWEPGPRAQELGKRRGPQAAFCPGLYPAVYLEVCDALNVCISITCVCT